MDDEEMNVQFRQDRQGFWKILIMNFVVQIAHKV